MNKKMRLRGIYYYVGILLILVFILVYLGKYKIAYSNNGKVVVVENDSVVEKEEKVVNDEVLSINDVMEDNADLVTKYYYVERIKPTNGVIEPIFTSNRYNYDLYVDNDVNSVAFDLEGYGILEVIGNDEETIDDYETNRIIEVLFDNDSSVKYYFDVHKKRSNDVSIKSIKSSYGNIEYVDGKNEYELVVPDSVKNISFEVVTNRSGSTVIGGDDTALNYGANIVLIDVIAQDEVTKNSIKINVLRQKEINDINSLFNNVVMDIGQSIELKYEIVPEDSSFKDVMIYSDNNEIVKVDSGSIIGVGYGNTKIHIVSNHNKSIQKEIDVLVINTKISSDKYSIYRDDIDYIIGLEPETKIIDFLSFIDGDVKIFNSSGDEISDYNNIVGTGMVLKKFINDAFYDSLIVIVRGDVDGNGVVMMSDYTKVNNFIADNSEVSASFLKASDVTKDGVVNREDAKMIYDYMLMKINTLN